MRRDSSNRTDYHKLALRKVQTTPPVSLATVTRLLAGKADSYGPVFGLSDDGLFQDRTPGTIPWLNVGLHLHCHSPVFGWILICLAGKSDRAWYTSARECHGQGRESVRAAKPQQAARGFGDVTAGATQAVCARAVDPAADAVGGCAVDAKRTSAGRGNRGRLWLWFVARRPTVGAWRRGAPPRYRLHTGANR